MLKTLMAMLKTLEMVLKPLWMLEKPIWVGEALMTHYVVIHALMVSWYLKSMPSYPTDDVMMNLDPWKSPGVVVGVE